MKPAPILRSLKAYANALAKRKNIAAEWTKWNGWNASTVIVATPTVASLKCHRLRSFGKQATCFSQRVNLGYAMLISAKILNCMPLARHQALSKFTVKKSPAMAILIAKDIQCGSKKPNARTADQTQNATRSGCNQFTPTNACILSCAKRKTYVIHTA